MEFEVKTLSNRQPEQLTLKAEIISFGTSSKLVLIIPQGFASTLKHNVPWNSRQLDHLSLPNRPVIVLADDHELADYSLYENREFAVSIGNTEKWVNDYVIYYRASVTGDDIDAFNAEIGKVANPNDLWAGLAETHVLIGTDLVHSQANSALINRILFALAGLIIVLFAISTVSNVMFFMDMTAGHDESVLAIISEVLAALFTVWAVFIIIFFLTSEQHRAFALVLMSLASLMLVDRLILTIAYIG